MLLFLKGGLKRGGGWKLHSAEYWTRMINTIKNFPIILPTIVYTRRYQDISVGWLIKQRKCWSPLSKCRILILLGGMQPRVLNWLHCAYDVLNKYARVGVAMIQFHNFWKIFKIAILGKFEDARWLSYIDPALIFLKIGQSRNMNFTIFHGYFINQILVCFTDFARWVISKFNCKSLRKNYFLNLAILYYLKVTTTFRVEYLRIFGALEIVIKMAFLESLFENFLFFSKLNVNKQNFSVNENDFDSSRSFSLLLNSKASLPFSSSEAIHLLHRFAFCFEINKYIFIFPMS